MDPDKIQSVVDWPTPDYHKALQRFLGFANFYRYFIHNYSQLVAPLTALTSTKVTFRWSSAAEAASSNLKKRFVSAPIRLLYGGWSWSTFPAFPRGRQDAPVVYQGPNQTNQDLIKAWLKHEEQNSTKGRTRQQQEVVNQIPSSSPSEYTRKTERLATFKTRILIDKSNSGRKLSDLGRVININGQRDAKCDHYM